MIKNKDLINLCNQMAKYIIAQQRGELLEEVGETYLVICLMSGRVKELADHLEKLVDGAHE